MQKRTDVYVLIMKLAEVEARRERFEEGGTRIEQARKNVGDSAAEGLITAQVRESLDAGHEAAQAVFRAGRQAIDRPDSIDKQPKEIAVRLWAMRAVALARRGDTGPATEAAEKVRKLGPLDSDLLVVVARTYAVCQHGESSEGEPRPAPAEEPLRSCRERDRGPARGGVRAAGVPERRLAGTGIEPTVFES